MPVMEMLKMFSTNETPVKKKYLTANKMLNTLIANEMLQR